MEFNLRHNILATLAYYDIFDFPLKAEKIFARLINFRHLPNCNLKPVTCNLVLQVHDELLFECDPKSVKEIAKMVKEKMENALKLSVPVTVDLKIGSNWSEMKTLKI